MAKSLEAAYREDYDAWLEDSDAYEDFIGGEEKVEEPDPYDVWRERHEEDI